MLFVRHVKHLTDKGIPPFGDERQVYFSLRLDPTVLTAQNIEPEMDVGHFARQHAVDLAYQRSRAFQHEE